MKYLKLFETFNGIYELKKPLPTSKDKYKWSSSFTSSDQPYISYFGFKPETNDQFIAIINALKEAGFNVNLHSNHIGKAVTNVNELRRDDIVRFWFNTGTAFKDPDPADGIGWAGIIKLNSDDGPQINWEKELYMLEFDDYFKLKNEFRGHNLKKFGV
jgi:hypothetical protein